MDQINNQPNIHFRKVSANQYKADKYKHVPKDYMRVAEGMEAQFTNHLLSQMQKTIDPANPESQAEKIYRSMQNDERAKLMAASQSGIGIKDMVLDQIYPQYKRQPANQVVKNYQQQVISHKGEQE